MKNTPVLAVLASGCLWGFIGMFSRFLSERGLSSIDIVVVRSGGAAALYAVTILIRDPALLRIKPRHLWCFLGGGVCGTLVFSVAYFTAIRMVGLSTAAILQYTSPSIVMVLSMFIFHERLTKRKLAALALAFAGCVLVSSPGGGEVRLSLPGILCGLCAGLGYALLTIFSRLAVDRGYASLTVNLYVYLFSALGAVLLGGRMGQFALSSWQNGLLCLATGLVTCYLPSWLYILGLSGLDAGKTSILASMDPVVAMLTDVFVFGQPLRPLLLAGAAIVILALAVLSPAEKAPPPSDAAFH